MPNRTPLALPLWASIALGTLTLGACERPADDAAPDDGAAVQTEPDQTADDDAGNSSDADDAPEVEVIRQGGESPLPTEPIDPGERDPDPDALDEETAADSTSSAASPLSAIPGFTPGELPVREPAPVGAADLPPDAPVMIQVTVFDITPASPAALESLSAFLGTDEGAMLDEPEIEALFELAEALGGSDDLKILSRPRVVISGGERGSIRLEEVPLPGSPSSAAAGVPGVRNTLLLQLAPAIGDTVGEGDGAVRMVRVGYDFAFTQGEPPLEVLAEDLGLPIGPRARVAGARAVPSGDAFFLVRRVAGTDEHRELLFLVRPQVMNIELNK